MRDLERLADLAVRIAAGREWQTTARSIRRAIAIEAKSCSTPLLWRIATSSTPKPADVHIGYVRSKLSEFDVCQLRPVRSPCNLAASNLKTGAGSLAVRGRRAMFRNILVHIPSERPVRPVIDVAVALTIARRSHLDAVAIGYRIDERRRHDRRWWWRRGRHRDGRRTGSRPGRGPTPRSQYSRSRPGSPKSLTASGLWRPFPPRPGRPSGRSPGSTT